MKSGINSMANSVSNNGNVSSIRETVNNNVSNYKILGQAKRFSWQAKRSFRAF